MRYLKVVRSGKSRFATMRILDDSSGLLTFWIVALIVSLECRAVRYQVHRLEEDAGVLDVRCGRRREYTC